MHRIVFLVGLCLAWPQVQANSKEISKSSAPRETTLADAMLAAYCVAGKGCHACVLPYSHHSVILAAGLENVEPGDVLLVSSREGEWNPRTRRGISTWELGIEFGGPGRDLLRSCYDRPALPGAIQPRDGTWEITPSEIRVENCPAAVEQQVKQQDKVQQAALRFRRPFLGALSPEAPEMVQLSPNAFRMAAQGGGSYDWTAVVVTAPDRMTLYTSGGRAIPDQEGVCSVTHNAEMVRIGD